MTLYQFIALDEGEQIEFIWSQEAIASRKEGDLQVELYQVEDFISRYSAGRNFTSG